MNEPASRQPFWYWGIVGLLLLAGAGALSTSADRSSMTSASSYEEARTAPDGVWEPSVEELAADFREFRQEVSQLTLPEQQEVWQSLGQRTESLAEQTLYTFFALPDERQQELLDRAIDRFEVRRRQWHERGGWGGGEGGSGRWPVREVSGDPDFNRPFAELSLEERLSVRRDMWQDATQQAHAMRSEFFRLLSERRRLRGLPEMVRRFG